MAKQYHTSLLGEPPYCIVLEELAMRIYGTSFTDHEVHRYLQKRGIHNPSGLVQKLSC